jgi:hypothetical protein
LANGVATGNWQLATGNGDGNGDGNGNGNGDGKAQTARPFTLFETRRKILSLGFRQLPVASSQLPRRSPRRSPRRFHKPTYWRASPDLRQYSEISR